VRGDENLGSFQLKKRKVEGNRKPIRHKQKSQGFYLKRTNFIPNLGERNETKKGAEGRQQNSAIADEPEIGKREEPKLTTQFKDSNTCGRKLARVGRKHGGQKKDSALPWCKRSRNEGK